MTFWWKFALCLLLCLLNSSLAAQDKQRIILASSDYVPHYGMELSRQGAVSEIVRRAFAYEDIDIEIAFMPFARALHDTQQGLFDGILAIWHTAEREQHLLYSDAIYPNQIVLFKRASELKLSNDLNSVLQSGSTLGMVTGYAQSPLLLNSALYKVSVATDEQVFRMLALARVDLVPADLQNGLYLLRQLPDSLRKVHINWISPPLEERPMHLAFPKLKAGSEELLVRFNRGLQQLRQTGELEQILAELLPEPTNLNH
jgi:polar amino acid transport system substrate-binding protein